MFQQKIILKKYWWSNNKRNDKIACLTSFTIQYVHSSGFGIAMNDIAFDDYKTISAEYYPEKPEMTFTPSYSILL